MRPITLLVATLGVVATAAFAQPPGGPGFGGPGGPLGPDVERLAVLLDLDPYQKQEVERVLKEQSEAVRAERATREGAGGERRSFAEMQALREQAREETITSSRADRTANHEAEAPDGVARARSARPGEPWRPLTSDT